MSRAREHEVSSPISLFPFIGILLCTMGALLVVLVAVSRSARDGAVRDTQSKHEANAAADTGLKKKLDEVNHYVGALTKINSKAETQLRDEHARLSSVEDHIRRLQDRMRELQIAARELASLEHAHMDDRAQAEREVTRLNQLIEDSRKTIESLEQEADKTPASYALVPYEGPNGTFRRPIYIECVKDEVILQPEGVHIPKIKLAAAQSAGNPLAAALRAARDHIVQMHPKEGTSRDTEPYPLIIVRPAGLYMFVRARQAVEAGDFELGFELVEEDWKLKFPEPDPQLANIEKLAVDQACARQELLAAAAPRAYAGRSARFTDSAYGTDDDGSDYSGGGGRYGEGGDDESGGGYGGGGDGRYAGGGGGGSGGDGSGGGYGQPGSSAVAGSGGVGGNVSGGVPTGGPGGGGSGGGNFGPGGGGPGGMGGGYASGGPGGPGGGGPGDGGNGGAGGGAYGEAGASGPGDTGGAAGGGMAGGGSGGGMAGGSGGSGAGMATSASSDPNAPPGEAGPQNVSVMMGATPPNASNSAFDSNGPRNRMVPPEQRGKDWALRKNSPRASAVRRTIRVVVNKDQLAILPDGVAKPNTIAGSKVVPLRGDTVLAVDDFVKEVHNQIDGWGIAGNGLYWRPVVVLSVAPDARGRADDLARLLRNSGLELKNDETANLAPQGAIR